jgi:hypothetical protein
MIAKARNLFILCAIMRIIIGVASHRQLIAHIRDQLLLKNDKVVRMIEDLCDIFQFVWSERFEIHCMERW